MTVYMTKMRQWDTSTIGRSSLIIKQILSIYILALWAWCLYNIYMEQGSQPNKQDIYVVIIEWNSVLINLFWIFSLVFEWKHFKLSLVGKKWWLINTLISIHWSIIYFLNLTKIIPVYGSISSDFSIYGNQTEEGAKDITQLLYQLVDTSIFF